MPVLAIFCAAATAAEAREIPRNEKALEILRQAKETLAAVAEEETDKDRISRQIAEAEARAGDLASAMSTALKNPIYRSALLAKIASVQAETGDAKGAFRTADKITEPEDKVEALVGIAKSHALVGKHDLSATAFNEALVEIEHVKGLPSRVRLYKVVSAAQNDLGDWSSAYASILMMPESIDKAEILSSMARQQIEKNNPKGALEIASAAREPNTRHAVYRTIAGLQADRGEVTRAFLTTELIHDVFYKASALSWIGAAQIRLGLTGAGKQTFQMSIRMARGIQENPRDKSLLLKEIGLAQSRAKFDAEARQNLQEARRVAHEILPDPECTKCLTLNAIGDVFTKAGFTEDAQETLQEAKRTALSIEGDVYYKTTMLLSVAEGEFAAGKLSDSLLTLQEAVNLSRLVVNDVDRVGLLIEIAAVYAKLGEMKQAAAVLEQASRITPRITDEDVRLATSISVALCRVRLGFLRAALESVQEEKDEDDRGELIGSITSEHASAGMAEEAYQWARNQPTPLLKTRALLGVATGMLQADEAARRVPIPLAITTPKEPEPEVNEEEIIGPKEIKTLSLRAAEHQTIPPPTETSTGSQKPAEPASEEAEEPAPPRNVFTASGSSEEEDDEKNPDDPKAGFYSREASEY